MTHSVIFDVTSRGQCGVVFVLFDFLIPSALLLHMGIIKIYLLLLCSHISAVNLS